MAGPILAALRVEFGLAMISRSPSTPSRPVLRLAQSSRSALLSVSVPPARLIRYDAFDAQFDQQVLAEARSWFQNFDASTLPRGSTTYARSSGPGGQHVNKTETKATTVYSVKDLLSRLPENLHRAVRSSKYYVASNDSLTFQNQSHRSRSANADENRQKLVDEIARIYRLTTPAETSGEKKNKHKMIEKRFHESRLAQKKFTSAKKQSRRGPPS
ncbi:uncharacterized protein UV8b_05428 [Ustilaginoidea virens]|uniref:Prokaryotic-type class I peptide chain release factors domain-containing protein n=1 Tax=Ustilaginoidea virens TaxID=1159556 RepID=A0A8E5HT62_USTVR|nr:uncharacterized protein UV8b_05428 [Ustilaginoidea virens]QUC21185.1 hypothetical protein UV8b_05428 [Ustilaginoidea virens]